MAKKNKRYSVAEKRAYWVGYGIGMANKDSEVKGRTILNHKVNGSIGYVPSITSAKKGFDAAMQDSDYSTLCKFSPRDKKIDSKKRTVAPSFFYYLFFTVFR